MERPGIPHADGAQFARTLGIYLNDHLAGATAGVELARRTARTHQHSDYASTLEHLAVEVDRDRHSLLHLMRALEVPVRRYKTRGAWAGEKIGRLKFNGRLWGRSPLSTVIELEGLLAGVQGKALLWQTLSALADHDDRLAPERIRELQERAEHQREQLSSLHAAVAPSLLSPSVREEGGKRAPAGEPYPDMRRSGKQRP